MTAPARPARGLPERIVLEGQYTRLEPIGLPHVADLYRAAVDGGEERFTWLFDQPPASVDDIADYVVTAQSKTDPMMWAVVDKVTGAAEGRQTLMRMAPEHGTIEIGNIYWGPRLARTRLATEALFLHARYIFDVLGYRRFEWKCNNLNEPSKRAALRFGFTFEGVFRQHMIVKGRSRDTAWFAMLGGDWPRIKGEFERWLSAENFTAEGTQRTRLCLQSPKS